MPRLTDEAFINKLRQLNQQRAEMEEKAERERSERGHTSSFVYFDEETQVREGAIIEYVAIFFEGRNG